MIRRDENLDCFINEQKRYYELSIEGNLDAGNWSEDIWGGVSIGWLANPNKQRINFSEIKRTKGLGDRVIDEVFKDFMKACVVYRYRTTRSKIASLLRFSIGLKRLYDALFRLTDQGNPTQVTNAIVLEALAVLRSSGTKKLYEDADYILLTQPILMNFGIVETPLVSNNPFPVSRSGSDRTLKQKQEGPEFIDDYSRVGEEQLLSLPAMRAIASVSNEVCNDYQRLGCRIVDLLIVTGMRVNEVLYLKRDCWVSRGVKPTGETYHGLKYFSEKGSDARIHWIEPRMTKIAFRAVSEILKITGDWHRHAKRLVASLGENVLPEELDLDLVDSDELMQACYRPASFAGMPPDAIADRSGQTVKKRIQDRWRKLVKRELDLKEYPLKITSKQATTLILSEFRDRDLAVRYDRYLDRSKIEINLDELLIIGPPGALQIGRGNKMEFVPQAIPSVQVNVFLGSDARKKSIFEIYEHVETDGAPIRLTSHMPRHQINTLLALMDLAEHLQAMMMGRRDIKQNKVYDHRNLQERQRISQIALPSEGQFDSVPDLPGIDAISKNENQNQGDDKSKNALIARALDEGYLDPELSIETNIVTLFSSLGSKQHQHDYVSYLLEKNSLDGGLQDNYQKLKSKSGTEEAKSLAGESGFSLNYLPNGLNCSKDISTGGCDKGLACLGGHPCPHLCLAGRPGELGGLRRMSSKLEADLVSVKENSEERQDSPSVLYLEELVRNTNRLVSISEAAHKKRVRLFPYFEGNKLLSEEPCKYFVDVFAKHIRQNSDEQPER